MQIHAPDNLLRAIVRSTPRPWTQRGAGETLVANLGEHMRKSFAMRLGAVGTAVVLAGGLAVVASGTTGAYFSESKAGAITGTIGAVHLETGNTTFEWTNMMPGEAKSAPVGYKNTGTGAQDFYLVFPNGPALHALNNLGTYGEVHVTDGNGAALFDSANLQDGRTRADGSNSCGAFSTTGCWPLPASLKIASNVATGASSSVTFNFNYPGKLGKGTSGGVGVFNTYPSTGPNSEAFGADLAGTPGSGLPFQIVAVQVGQLP